MCGVFGVTNVEHASKIAYLGLFALQHRGQESAGISVTETQIPDIRTHRDMGLVADVFKEHTLTALQGNNAIGHVRYSTAGGNTHSNIQPITANVHGMPVALSHNGNIENSKELRNFLESSGSIIHASSDSEIILHLIARSNKLNFIEKLVSAFEQLTGAFSILLLTPTHLYAVVDSFAYRPLSLGKMQKENSIESWIIASETCAMDLVGAQFIRDLLPGEILSIDLSNGEMQSYALHQSREPNPTPARCVFEHVYFARPDSLVWNILAQNSRFALGEELANSLPVAADMVIAVPDSGVPMAMGYAHASRIPYKIGFIRNHYVGRTFIEPAQNVRNFKVRLKLNPVRETIRGKKIIVIDDSIVRGTTSRKIIELLYEAGASEVHLRIGSPPVKFPCFYGIDTPKRKELLAQQLSLEDMNRFLKSTTLAFLSQTQLLNVMQKLSPSTLCNSKSKNGGWCVSCFSGEYQKQNTHFQQNPTQNTHPIYGDCQSEC